MVLSFNNLVLDGRHCDISTYSNSTSSIQVYKHIAPSVGGAPVQIFCTGTPSLCKQTDTERRGPVRVKEKEPCAGVEPGQGSAQECHPSVNRQTQRGKALYRLRGWGLVQEWGQYRYSVQESQPSVNKQTQRERVLYRLRGWDLVQAEGQDRGSVQEPEPNLHRQTVGGIKLAVVHLGASDV